MLRNFNANAFVIFASFSLSCGVASAARLALVVGNDSYQTISKLQNARADADSMADAFRQAGYAVTLRKDRNQREFKDDVRDLRSKIRGGDEVVFFYSGHGVALGATNYLLPTDVRGQSEAQIMDDALALSDVLAQLAEAQPALTLAIIDACRDNPFPPRGGKSIGSRGLVGAAAATGQMVIYAAGTGQQALDRLSANDPVKNGVFTRAFVAEMKTPNVPIDRVLKQVRTRVAAAARSVGHAQVPAIYDQVEGDFYFYRQASIVPETVAQQPVRPAPVPSPERIVTGPMPTARRAGDVFRNCSDCPELVVIPSGSFTMGGNEYDHEKPEHGVSIMSFALGKTEVTQGQWRSVMGSNPSHFQDCGDACPVERVSWNDVQDYIKRLNAKTGQRYRLPSEAEWEYAARGGTTTKWHHGDGETALGEYAWYDANSGDKTHAVAQKRANSFGLFDMHGNAWEWVEDCFHDNYSGAPSDGSAWTTGCNGETRRVLRGGSWFFDPAGLRSARRHGAPPGDQSSLAGFRLAMTF